MGNEFVVGVKVHADAAQYTAEFIRAGQVGEAFAAQMGKVGQQAAAALQAAGDPASHLGTAMASSAAQASAGLDLTTTSARAAGAALAAAGAQGKQGFDVVRAAGQAASAQAGQLGAAVASSAAQATAGLDATATSAHAASAALVAAGAQGTNGLNGVAAAGQAAAAQAGQLGTAVASSAAQATASLGSTATSAQAAGAALTAAGAQGKQALGAVAAASQAVASGQATATAAIQRLNQANAAGSISAAQHAAAMRMLPAQITDVVTSVASGMPIWLVAIQQGGQIKDSFGGIANAAKALVGAITPAAAAIGAVAAGVGLAAAAYYQGSAEADRYREAIVMSGNAAGVTVGQLNEMAKAVSGNIGTQNEASRALAEMTRYGKVSGESLQYFTEVAMGLEKYAGQSIKSTVQDLAALGKAPLEASVKLNEQYNYLTPAVYRQIEALEKQGRTEEAAAVAQNAYVKAFESRKNEMQANLGYLEKTWYSLGNAAKWAWDRILNVGRASTDEENLAVLKQNLAAMEERNARPGFKEGKATQEKREEIRLLEEKIAAQRKSALAQADAASATQETANFGRMVAQYASNEVKRKQELDTAQQLYNKALKAAGDDAKARNQVERDYEALVTSINKKFQERKSGAGQVSITDTQLAGLRGQLEAAQLYQEQLKSLGASASELNAGERESIKLAEQIKVATNEKTRAKLEEAKAIADALGVQLRSNDALEKTFKAQQAVIDSNYKDADALIRRAEQQEAANEVYGKGRTAIERMTLATLEHQLAEAEGSDSFDPKYIASLEKKIEAQKRYVDALGQADYKAVMEHADELLRNAQELSKLYEDELALSGLTELEREKIVAQRQVELKYAKELAALDKQSLTDAEKQAAREKLLEAQRVESAAAVGKAQQTYNNKMADQLNESLTDALMRGFEAGKGFAENLRDTVKNMFNTMVLRPVISAVMAPVSGVINNVVQTALGTVGLGSSGGNAGSLLSGAQNLSSLYSAVTGGITSTVAGGIASAGALFGSSALTSFAAGMKGATLAAGLAGPTTAGASGAMGLGASFGVAMPWIAGAVALYAIAKSLDNGGTPHVGAGAVYDDGVTTGGRETVNVNQAKNWSSTTQSGVSSLATTLGGMFDGLSEAFGKSKGWRVETGFSGDGDDKSRGLLSISDADGKSIASWGGKSGRYSSNVEKAWGQYIQEVSGSTLAALREIAPAWGDAILDGAAAQLDKLSGTEKFEAIAQLAQQIAATKAQLVGLGDAMSMFKDMTDSVESTLLSVSGGIDALVNNASQFYDLYYSDAEKQAKTFAQLQEVFAKYDAEVPATRAEYRALLEAQMAAGESGAEFAAVLLGLSSQFASISDTWVNELSGMSKSVTDFFADLKDSIASVQGAVAASRKDILRGDDAMTRQELADAIAGINTVGPNLSGVNNAAAAVSAAAATAAQAQSVRDAFASAAGTQQSTLSGLQGQRSDAQAKIDAAKKNADDTQAWAMDQWLNRRGSHSYRKYTVTQIRDDAQAAYEQTLQQMTAAIAGLDVAIAQQQVVYDDAAAAAKVYADQLAAAQAALASTQQSQVQAQVDYVAAMREWVVEAGGSVDKLSDLRGEVVNFYQAQAAAVKAMLQSAGNLRSVIDQVRLGQLDTAQTATELGSRYSVDYAMALATTGATRAGYVDAMAGNLQGLSDALKAEAATGADWRIETARLLAQATNAAGLLEGDAAADDYQDVALGLLGSIDSALESLSAATVSAEQVIANAINASSSAQLDGLRAIVAALKGEPIPAFASGGSHYGGLRIVGERGWELEATGPSRIWNQSQLATALSGNGNPDRAERLSQQQIEESRIQAMRTVDLLMQLLKILQRWEVLGVPSTRKETA